MISAKDNVSDAPITISLTENPGYELLYLVTGLQVQAVMSNELITRLEWEASGNSNVKEYDIYFKESGKPYLTWLATTANTFFDTAHPWAADATILTRLYAVSAVDNNGCESFLSEFEPDGDVDGYGLAFFIHQLDAGSSCVDLEGFADFFGR